MLVIGLTGGVGSGKTTVANLFANKNVPIVDTDIIAHQLTKKGQTALTAITKHFGTSILLPNGELNRSALRKIVFENNQERHWLERLLHPKIKKIMQQQIKTISAPYCIAIIPLLFEVEFYSEIHRTLVVDAKENTQIQRVMKRDHLTKEQVEAIIRSQASRKSRLIRAHDIIVNNHNNISELQKQVDQLHEKYMYLATDEANQ